MRVFCDTSVLVAGCVRLHPYFNRARPVLEASGGVNLDTIARIAATGVDFISIGALTHSAPVLDIGLDIRPTVT